MWVIRFAASCLASAALAAPPLGAQHFPPDPEIQALLEARVDAGGAVGTRAGRSHVAFRR